jgi:hypothetical protein
LQYWETRTEHLSQYQLQGFKWDVGWLQWLGFDHVIVFQCYRKCEFHTNLLWHIHFVSCTWQRFSLQNINTRFWSFASRIAWKRFFFYFLKACPACFWGRWWVFLEMDAIAILAVY